jgi:hypothetical protein
MSGRRLPTQAEQERTEELLEAAWQEWKSVYMVRQEDPWGCTVAALAMVLGTNYAELKAEIQRDHPDRDFQERGINYMDADQILTAKGYATARVFRYFVSKPREEWPPAPFGAVHLCEVRVTPTSPGHTVVMLADGSVLDPLTDEPRRLTDYDQVSNVAAVVRMTPALISTATAAK